MVLDSHVMLILTNNNKTHYGELINSDVDELTSRGDQPTLNFFKDNRKILVWNKSPNKAQSECLVTSILSSIFQKSMPFNEQYKEYLLKYTSKQLSNQQTRALIDIMDALRTTNVVHESQDKSYEINKSPLHLSQNSSSWRDTNGRFSNDLKDALERDRLKTMYKPHLKDPKPF